MEWYEKSVSRNGVVNKKVDRVKVKAYLDDTDWYIIRYAETTDLVPAEVLAKREQCRELLSA